MKPALAALALLLAAEAFAQDRRVAPQREFTVRMNVPEKPAQKTLWASRDGGKTWKTAKDAGVAETWEAWDGGFIRCRLRVPDDGSWDFYVQFEDAVGNRAPEPAPGQPGDPLLRFDVREQSKLAWASPKGGEEFIGGNQVFFRWTSEKKGLKEKSLQLYVQVDGQPWKVVATALPLEGELPWVLPATTSETKIRFRLAAFTPEEQEVTSRELEAKLVPGRTVVSLAWDQPRGSPDWTGGATVTLKWTSLGPEFRERSAELQYAVDEDPWTPITRGLEATGSYLWVVPNRETSQLRLRVRATTRAGQEAAAVTEAITVRVVTRPNVAQARALYDRARVLAAQQRYGEAMLKYEEALAAWSDFAEVLNDLGKLYADQKEPTKALEYFLRARKTCPSSPVAYVNAAMMEARLGLHDDAMADLQDALSLGVERDERTAVLAAETLRRVAVAAELAENWDRLKRACGMILSIRQASPPTRARAQQYLDWLKNRAK
jgi:tetratricopeptide (TPR) repeat protein